MMDVERIKRWLDTLPPSTMVGVDDGGLTLRATERVVGWNGVSREVWLEIGGIPEEDDNDAS